MSNIKKFFSLIVTLFIITTLLPTLQARPMNNEQILSKLGLRKLRVSPSHHRKRLAVESRHHQSSDDSHMFVIKLPPKPYYYVHNKPNVITADTGKNLPVGFKSNGKPAKIYHWNIPVLKKIVTKQAHKSRLDDGSMHKLKKLPMKDYEKFANEVHDKLTNVNRKYQKSPTYYAPTKPKKGSVHKFYGGNGKPQSFYVIEKSKKPHYHRLLP